MFYYHPRLAVYKLSMEPILRFKEMLLTTLKSDYNLTARYQATIQINVNIDDSEAAVPTGSFRLQSEKNKMHGGWQIEDVIMDCQ